jgi:chaperonin GroEL
MKSRRRIVKRALEEPLRQLAANAGDEGATVVQNVRAKKGNVGYNAESGEYEDLFRGPGVLDPTKVTRTACRMPRALRRCC